MAVFIIKLYPKENYNVISPTLDKFVLITPWCIMGEHSDIYSMQLKALVLLDLLSFHLTISAVFSTYKYNAISVHILLTLNKFILF